MFSLRNKSSLASFGFKSSLVCSIALIGAFAPASTYAKPAVQFVHYIASPNENPMQASAEKLIISLGDKAIAFLNNKALTDAQRTQEFTTLLRTHFDLKTLGRFALGRYWRASTKEQRSEYQSLFEQMVVDVYSGRFKEYSGQKFIVNGSRQDSAKDTLVNSVIIPKDGKEIKVDWRVRRKKDGSFKVIDVIVAGVSMSVTQRSDFSAVIQRGGGNVDALISHLKDS